MLKLGEDGRYNSSIEPPRYMALQHAQNPRQASVHFVQSSMLGPSKLLV